MTYQAEIYRTYTTQMTVVLYTVKSLKTGTLCGQKDFLMDWAPPIQDIPPHTVWDSLFHNRTLLVKTNKPKTDRCVKYCS